jgi:hypothetical protein
MPCGGLGWFGRGLVILLRERVGAGKNQGPGEDGGQKARQVKRH